MSSKHYVDRVETEIRFRNEFRQSLLAGEKRGTLRLGRRVPQTLEIPVVLENSERIGYALIDVLIWVKLVALERHPEIFAREYPKDHKELLAKMREIYPHIEDESWLTFYGFRLQTSGA